MQVIIRETSAVETLSIIDPKTGVNYIADFIGNTGALTDGQFEWDEDRYAYVCDQDTYDWWDRVVNDNQALDDRIHRLAQEYGSDEVYPIVQEAAACADLEDVAEAVNEALNATFGDGE